ncbi:hypothetical protein MLD38_019523 [Melastoma candidum]|uniref:Uncharacterized protein n=1 Tax=Melastoma candidum TaxID=119954 RepID=A0ACB9QWQ1_9MYRT|nr:hypothetical protein MLD38_019523 [Melastoma candidum]
MDGVRKRGRLDSSSSALSGGFKKSKQETESLSSGVGSKSKPCTKFFSTAGCPFGEGCHFMHYFPGGYNAVAQLMNLTPAITPPARHIGGLSQPPMTNGSSSPAVKTRICNRFNTAEGCKFGDKCNFAHGEWELGKPINPSFDDQPRTMGSVPGRFVGRMDSHALPGPTSSFGASSTAKISIDASLAGAIIGKGGVNSKQISHQTGAKFFIRDHESNPSLKNVELEGSLEQIQEASIMVRQLIMNITAGSGPGKGHGPGHHSSNYKTKLCDNFTKGSCTFGEKCHFAHGAAELRKTVI